VTVEGEMLGDAERVDVRKAEVGVDAATTGGVQLRDGHATGIVWLDEEDGDPRAGGAHKDGNAATRSPATRRPKATSVDGRERMLRSVEIVDIDGWDLRLTDGEKRRNEMGIKEEEDR